MPRKSMLAVLAALLLAGCVPTAPDGGKNKLDAGPAPAVRTAIDKVSPAVVRLDVIVERFSRGQPVSMRSQGSGVIIDAEGHILTNFHVAGRAKRIDITLANLEHVRATLVGSDHWTDLALVKLDLDEVKRKKLSFSFAALGDSAEIALGQPVLALGTPYGLSRTITQGIVSNKDRFFDQTTIGGYETGWFNNWIQMDAAINPGNSGGPLINLRGEVIGINTRGKPDGNNLGFAIPINVAREVAREILAKKKVNRSYIGLILQPMQDLEKFYDLSTGGVLIASVEKDSPAAMAGVKPEHILLAVNDTTVDARFPEQLAAVRKLIADQPIGTDIKLTLRKGKGAGDQKVTVTVSTDKLESVVAEEKPVAAWGLSVRDVTRAYLRDARMPMLKGVLVTGVTTGLPADRAGLLSDDIVLRIDGRPVTNVEEFEGAVNKCWKTQKPVAVVVRRDRNEVTRVVKARD